MRSIIASILCAVTLLLFSTVSGSLAASLYQDNDGQEYVVQAGDTLSLIADGELGDVNAWQQIIDATNEKALDDDRFETIEDPTLIEVGQLLWIPVPAAATDAPAELEPELDNATDLAPAADEETPPEDQPDSDVVPSVTSTIPPTTESITSTVPAQLLIPYSLDGRRYGYIDQSGEFQIEPTYLIARRFSEGLAVVSLDGLRFGYIDTSGALVIPAQFSDAGPFSEGLAAVRSDDSIPTLLFYDYALDEEIEILPSGYINSNGEFEIEPLYAYAEPFRGGLAVVWDEFSSRSYLNRAGEPIQRIGETAPTQKGIISRSELTSALTDAPVRDGLCENTSTFGQDPTVWSCRVDEELFDPCFIQESSEQVFGCGLNAQGLITCDQQPAPPTLVCGYPLNAFAISDSESASLPSIILPSDFNIERYQIRLDVADSSQDEIDCMLIAQETLVGAPPEIYICSDGTFIIDELWEIADRGVWMARTVRLAGTGPDYEFVESTVAVVDQVWDFSTAQRDEQSTDGILPPAPPDPYWRH